MDEDQESIVLNAQLPWELNNDGWIRLPCQPAAPNDTHRQHTFPPEYKRACNGWCMSRSTRRVPLTPSSNQSREASGGRINRRRCRGRFGSCTCRVEDLASHFTCIHSEFILFPQGDRTIYITTNLVSILIYCTLYTNTPV